MQFRLICIVARLKSLNLHAQVGKICCINAESTILLLQCHANKPPLWGTRVSGTEVQRAKSVVFFLSTLLARWAKGGGDKSECLKTFIYVAEYVGNKSTKSLKTVIFIYLVV
jgi:hypothetical protein